MEINIREIVTNLQQQIADLKKTNTLSEFELEMEILKLNPIVYDKYPSLVKRLCKNDDNQDNTYLYKMIELIEDINNGNQEVSNVEKKLGDELANKFIYPQINNLKLNE